MLKPSDILMEDISMERFFREEGKAILCNTADQLLNRWLSCTVNEGLRTGTDRALTFSSN